MNETSLPPACDFVVIGGTGDLAMRKLLPALFLRERDEQLPAGFRVIGLSLSGLDDAAYRDKVRGELAGFGPEDDATHR
jgi:glucose-6-phosphate 1-dehydrogenase